MGVYIAVNLSQYLPVQRLLFRVSTLVALVGLFTAAARADTRWATLKAIHLLENPNDRTTPGPYGELGAYQFRSSVWYRYTRQPFSHALNRAASDAIALRHYDYLKTQLELHGIPATPYNIAKAWNGGLGAALAHRSSHAAREYAQRASNMAASFDTAVAATP